RRCDAMVGQAAGPDQPKCPLDPFIILPDSTEYVDQQRLKLQENPETVPTGELPRHISLSLDRFLVGRAKPGTRVTVVGIYDVFQNRQNTRNSGLGGGGQAVALRFPYLRAVGIVARNEASELLSGSFRPEDEE